MRTWIRTTRRRLATLIRDGLTLGMVLPGDPEQDALEPGEVITVDFGARTTQHAPEPAACA